MLGARPKNNNILLILQQLLHKLWGIEYTIVSMVSLDYHFLNLRLPLKGVFCLDILSSVYNHLVIYTHINTDIVNKETSTQANLICI